MRVEVDVIELDKIFKTLNKIENSTIKKVRELNGARARKYKIKTEDFAKYDALSLMQNQPATVKIQGKEHPPLYFTGKMVEHIGVKDSGENDVESGFFASDTETPQNSDLSYTMIAQLQHTGYRIPLIGAKGERVRAFLAAHGIYPSKNKEFIVVTPRPLIFNSMEFFEESGEDVLEINRYIDRLWKNL